MRLAGTARFSSADPATLEARSEIRSLNCGEPSANSR